ncbi:MAG: hypothetical protein U0805_20905 [Pirellulales bacterium]
MAKNDNHRPELAEFTALVESTMKERSIPRDQASAIVVKKYPKLHARMIREANADRPRALALSGFADDSPRAA